MSTVKETTRPDGTQDPLTLERAYDAAWDAMDKAGQCMHDVNPQALRAAVQAVLNATQPAQAEQDEPVLSYFKDEDCVKFGCTKKLPRTGNSWGHLYVSATQAAQSTHWTETEPVRLAPSRVGRVYVAGPMTGIADFNFPAFNAEAEALRAQGLSVLNPADHGIVAGANWADYLRHDIAGLSSCERIHLLRGWSKSKGAQLEVTIASALGMVITYQDGAETAQAAQGEPVGPLKDADALEIGKAAGLPMVLKSGEFPWAYVDKVVTAIKNAHARGVRSGFEVYAKNIDDVVARLTEMAERIESLEGAQPAPAQAAQGEPVQPFLVRDVADMLGVDVPHVCKTLVALGFAQKSTNMEITPDEALAVAKAHRDAVAQGAGEVVARWKFELRQAIIEYGSAVKRGDDEAIRETTQRGCDLIDAYPSQPAAPAQGAGEVVATNDHDGLVAASVIGLASALHRIKAGNLEGATEVVTRVRNGLIAHGYMLTDTQPAAGADVVLGLPIEQEPKYTTDGTRIINRHSGEAVPHDEPVFLFRARDAVAVHALTAYFDRIQDREPLGPHAHAVAARIDDFRRFASEHNDRMKWPDTAAIAASGRQS